MHALVNLFHSDATPVEKRDLDWVVNKFSHSYKSNGPYSRFIHDAEDSDIGDEGNFVLNRKRRLRHISRAEIADTILPHCEWLLAQMLAPKNRMKRHIFVDLHQWYKVSRCSLSVRFR